MERLRTNEVFTTGTEFKGKPKISVIEMNDFNAAFVKSKVVQKYPKCQNFNERQNSILVILRTTKLFFFQERSMSRYTSYFSIARTKYLT